MRARRVGEHGLLVECTDLAEVEATYATLRERSQRLGATDLVPAARTVLLDGLDDVDAAEALVADLVAERSTPAGIGVEVVEVPVTYDGPDLEEVARQWQVDLGEVVSLHVDTEFTVAFCGFAPGFAYCAGLPSGRSVRRRTEPRPRVEPGAVGLAGEFTSVYPSASPGGWQLIGRTEVRVWRPELSQPALLEPGTRVRFVRA